MCGYFQDDDSTTVHLAVALVLGNYTSSVDVKTGYTVFVIDGLSYSLCLTTSVINSVHSSLQWILSQVLDTGLDFEDFFQGCLCSHHGTWS